MVYIRVVGLGFFEIPEDKFRELVEIASKSDVELEEVLKEVVDFIVKNGKIVKNPIVIEGGADYIVIPDAKVLHRILEIIEKP